MGLPPFDPSQLYGYIGTFIVGGGMAQLVAKLTDLWFKRGEQQLSLQDELRDELRESVKQLLTQLKEQTRELDELRDKYFLLREENARLIAEVEILKARIEQQGQLAQKAASLASTDVSPTGLRTDP